MTQREIHSRGLARASLPAARRGAVAKGCAIGLGAVALIGLILAGIGVLGYNAMVQRRQAVEQTWAEVENQYKRRFELIPNLVNTVKGAADFEQTTLQNVIEARAQVGRVQMPEQLPTDPRELEAYLAAQQSLSGALGRLFAVAEQYPQLRATESFRDLQVQIEGTENRIAVARNKFTEAVRDYNTTVLTFPRNLIAGMFGFERLPQFSAPAEEQEVPEVEFDFGGD